MSETHLVRLEVVLTMPEMDGTPEESAQIADAIVTELLESEAAHWEAKVKVIGKPEVAESGRAE